MGENSLEPALPLALSLSMACQLDFFMGVILIDVCLCISLAGTILACKTFAVPCCLIFFVFSLASYIQFNWRLTAAKIFIMKLDRCQFGWEKRGSVEGVARKKEKLPGPWAIMVITLLAWKFAARTVSTC